MGYVEVKMLEIVCGKPGKGKTSYVVAHVVNEELKFNNPRYFRSLDYIRSLSNKHGIKLAEPPERHVVHANFDIYTRFPAMKNYEMSGWDFGVPNTYHPTTRQLIPYALYIFDEAQRYFDSKSDILPPWVTQAFELRRHIGIDIYLIAQRYIRIHKDIREIADVFTYIDEITHTYILPSGKKCKSHVLLPEGKIIETKWDFHQFENENELQRYIDGERHLGVRGHYKFVGDINQHYDTHNYAVKLEDLSKDFEYHDYSPVLEEKPETWSNYKKAKKKKSKEESENTKEVQEAA